VPPWTRPVSRVPAPWPSTEDEVENRQIRRHIDAAIESLPARQRFVITLRDVNGYSADEVCSILTISAANQRVLLHRARAAVRARLEDYFTAADRTPR
jgi:RNA polymerase sigma-70 factor, ECF subfamily